MRRYALFWAAISIFAFWQALAWLLNLEMLPGPVTVIVTFFRELGGELGVHLLASAWRVIASMALSILLATPAGLVLGQSKRWGDFFAPFIYLLYPIPKVVFVPIVILFLGINDFSKIAMIFLILFFQILILVRDQAAAIRPELISSVRSLGAGRKALFRYVYFPACLPAVLSAIRQSIGTAVAVLYIVELIATTRGLGYYIYLNGSTLLDYPKMYAGVMAMSLLGLVLYYAADMLHRKLCPWQFAGREQAD